MKTVSSSVTPELEEELKAYAAKHRLSLSTAIRGILEEWATEDCLWAVRVNKKDREKGFLERFFS